MPTDPWIVLAAAFLEASLGYPDWLHRRLPHPVTWAGGLIGLLDRSWNREDHSARRRRILGVAALLIVAGLAALLGWVVGLADGVVSIALIIAFGSLGLAQKSLFQHVEAVRRSLDQGDLADARKAVSAIVGRDVELLDESGVASAALESLAESFNDGVVAPLLWFLVGGLPGLFVYKVVNTADSMIGHLEPRWRDFGWAAARTDDLLNLIPARLAGALICMVGGRGWSDMWRDAGKHASPNAGWPEAAMAGALDVQLGGPVAYDGVAVQRPTFGHGARPITGDLRRGLKLYVAACGVLWFLLAMGGLAWPR